MPETLVYTFFLVAVAAMVVVPVYTIRALKDHHAWGKALDSINAVKISSRKKKEVLQAISRLQYRNSSFRQPGVTFRVRTYELLDTMLFVLDVRRIKTTRGGDQLTQELIVFKPSCMRRSIVVTNLTSEARRRQRERTKVIGLPRYPLDTSYRKYLLAHSKSSEWTMYVGPSRSGMLGKTRLSSETIRCLNEFDRQLPVWCEVSEQGVMVATSLNSPTTWSYSAFRVSPAKVELSILKASRMLLLLEKDVGLSFPEKMVEAAD